MPRETCEYSDCPRVGTRVIVVTGYGGREERREQVCRPHVGPMIAQKQQGYRDYDLAVPAMRDEPVS